jgi:GAF domain-containing protein
MDDVLHLGDVFVFLSDSLDAGHDIVDTMNVLVDASTRFTTATQAGIVLAGPDGALHVVASTSERTSEVEERQLGTREGPCIEAFLTGRAVEIADVSATAGTWPDFAAAATACGFRSVHTVPLRLRTRTLGSLNLFSPDIGPLGDTDAALVQALADVATIGLIHHRSDQEHVTLNHQLQRALDSRIVIEQAKGVLAERHGIPVDKAFALLRHTARGRGARLHDVAQEVMTGKSQP